MAVFLIGTVAAVLAFAPPALGATVRYDAPQKRIYFTAADGEQNVLNVDQSASTYTFTDTGTGLSGAIPINDGDGLGPCEADLLMPNVATCPVADVNKISVSAGNKGDAVQMNAAPPQGTIIGGGPGSDNLFGGPGDDQISGREGADDLRGGFGNDTIDSGDGVDPESDDCLIFERCDDYVNGASGFDKVTYANRTSGVLIDLKGGTGPSRYALDSDGTKDTDLVQVEQLIGGSGNDQIYGGPYGEFIKGGPGDDVLCGGLGVDTVDYSDASGPVNVTLDGTLPTDRRTTIHLAGSGTTDAEKFEYGKARIDCREVDSNGLSLNDGQKDCTPNDGVVGSETDCVGEDVENVIGGPFDDKLVGNDRDPLEGGGPRVEPAGINHLEGRGGNDVLDGAKGPDQLDGGVGNDTVTYASRAESVSATIDGAANDGSADDQSSRSLLTDNIGEDVENVVGGKGDDTINGNAAANVLQGGEGNDFIDGKGGNDSLQGQIGDDWLQAGAGDDSVYGGDPVAPANADGFDVLDGGDGADLLRGGTNDDDLIGGFGSDDMAGEGGKDDLVDYSAATTSVSVTADGVADDGREGEKDNVAPDVESANGGTDNDTLTMGAGDGVLFGGAGDDVLDGGPGADDLIGGTGLDAADYSKRTAPVTVEREPRGDGEQGEGDDVADDVEKLIGGSAADSFTGSAGTDVLIGNGGADELSGEGGDDQLFGDAGADQLSGGPGGDTLDAGAENDSLSGGDGNDKLRGGDGNDSLDGGAGADVIGGGGGTDAADYSTRINDLTLTLNGAPDDGEAGEGDLLTTDVEDLLAGQGDDLIAAKNGIAGRVSCGRGNDQASIDTFDDLGGDCEEIINQNPCKPSPEPVSMSRSGVVGIKVSCTEASTGTLTLETFSAVKSSRKRRARKVTLGRKSFSVKTGQAVTVKVKVSRTGRRVVRRSKRGISARAILVVRKSFGVRALSMQNGDKLTVKAKR